MAFYYGLMCREWYEEIKLHNIARNYAVMYNDYLAENHVKLAFSEIKRRMHETRVDAFRAGFILDFIFNSCGYIEKVRFIEPETDEICIISIPAPVRNYSFE